MPPLITTLIDRQDNSEVIRDQIAAIIAVESANQVALAVAASKPEPDDWKLRVFTEASNPWEQFRNFDPGVTDDSPLVNVWFDNVNFDRSKSDTFERQKADGVFNIDIYGIAVSSDDGGTGQNPGDRDAALEVQRGARLVRSILMAAIYNRLGMDGVVWDRWPGSITVFQPEVEEVPIQHVIAARFVLEVGYNEFSPQIEMETLELLANDVHRALDGSIIVEADIAFPLS